MSAKILAVTNRFYLILTLVVLVLVILAFYTLKEIFGGLSTASQVDPKIVGSPPSINKVNLDKAYDLFFGKKYVSLD